MKPHAFVAMPFGKKPDANGQEIDFNSIYEQYIQPALEAAGMEVFRADEELRAGEIRKDMFLELLVADLVVADLSIENPNVWYELGVRHALRSRGVVLIYAGGSKKAFDIYTDRKLRYSLKDGHPDPDTLSDDIKKLTGMVKATMESWHGRKISPVFDLLPNLQEPDWKTIRGGHINELWEKYDTWEDKIKLARRNNHIGDILILAGEAPIAALQAEAYFQAGQELRKAESYLFAIEQLEKGLSIDPTNVKALREKGTCLQRLALGKVKDFTLDKARQHYQNMLEKLPNDSETWALYARVDKDAWIDSWKRDGFTQEQMIEAATYQDALLSQAIESYLAGYHKDIRHHYSGINALTLMCLYQHLTGETIYHENIVSLSVTVKLAATQDNDFWGLTTLGDLEVLIGTPETVKKAYKKAISKNDKDWFSFNSSLSQLLLLKDLNFNLPQVEAGISTFEIAMTRLRSPWKPRKVFLFSGHMIDTADRLESRFPETKVSVAKEKILEILKKLDAGEEDLALTQGACGGDILFTEACQSLGVKVRWQQPFEEPQFIEKSVIRCGEVWRDRYYKCKERLDTPIRHASIELGQLPENMQNGYPYERCNLWLLYTAFSYDLDKVNFICLWDEKAGDGPGGTEHMYTQVKNRTGQVNLINTVDL